MNSFETPINTYEMLSKGFARSRLTEAMASMLQRRLPGLNYVDLPADHCDAGPRQRALLEEAPQISELLRNMWKSLIGHELKDLAEHYHAGVDPHLASVLRLGSGYELDWHNHLAAGCDASLLIYLFDELSGGQGGDLLIGTLGPDLKTPTLEHRLSISHGDAILLGDRSHPLSVHKAERWEGEGYRYILSFGFNSEDW